MKTAHTHEDLVAHAAWWARGRLRLCVVLAEPKAIVCNESPDVIGWTASGLSALIEVKTSRADFIRDRNKPFRKDPERGMGRMRWFFTPVGLIDPAELPKGWGLAEWNGWGAKQVKRPTAFTPDAFANAEERRLLINATRRRAWGGPAAVHIFQAEPDEGDW